MTELLTRWRDALDERCPGHHGAPPIAWIALALLNALLNEPSRP